MPSSSYDVRRHIGAFEKLLRTNNRRVQVPGTGQARRYPASRNGSTNIVLSTYKVCPNTGLSDIVYPKPICYRLQDTPTYYPGVKYRLACSINDIPLYKSTEGVFCRHSAQIPLAIQILETDIIRVIL